MHLMCVWTGFIFMDLQDRAPDYAGCKGKVERWETQRTEGQREQQAGGVGKA